jgi:hypothetical protein
MNEFLPSALAGPLPPAPGTLASRTRQNRMDVVEDLGLWLFIMLPTPVIMA